MLEVPGIRLGRGTRLSCLNLHPKTNHKGLVSIREHPWVLGQATGTWTHKTHHGPDSREATTFPLIVFSAAPREGYIQMALFPWTPKVESRNCPDLDSRVWASITCRLELGSGRGFNQSCSSPWELSNAMSHIVIGRREEVDSWLLVVRSQIANLTPSPSFVHNLGCRCPNDQCEASLDIYTSRTFQWNQEHPNARCFGPSTRALSFWEFRRTPSSHFWECGLHPHT